MLVIAILGIFFAIVSQFDFSSRVNQEKATNFANLIADTFRDTRHNAMIGKMSIDRSEVEYHQFFISKNMFYAGYKKKWWTGVEKEKQFSWIIGFIDDDKNYKIEKIEVFNNILLRATNTLGLEVQGLGLRFNDNMGDYFTTIYTPYCEYRPHTSKVSFPDGASGLGLMQVCYEDSLEGAQDIPFWNFKITVDYKWVKYYIYGDAISGAIEVLKHQK